MNIQIVSVEGNIGSGKSTLISSLKNMHQNSNKVYFLQEPVDEWTEIKDTEGINIIQKFYLNQKRYSFAFQMMAYISRLAMLKRAIEHCKNSGIKVIICERSLNTDKYVFCKMLYDSGKIESIEYQIYLKWFEEFIKEIPSMTYVYIKTDPKVALDRVLKRSRPGETIDLEYLTMCNNYHDMWLNTRNCFIIDGNYASSVTYEKVIEIVGSFI